MSEQSRWISVPTADGPMSCFIAVPTSRDRDRGPAVLVLQEALGLTTQLRSVCLRLAAEGYVAVAPDLFHRLGDRLAYTIEQRDGFMAAMKASTNEMLRTDLLAAHAAVSSLDEVDPRRIGALGFCMGGMAAVLASAVLPLRVSVAYYPTGMTALREGIGYSPILAEFPEIQCPLQLFFGEKDVAIPLEEIELIRERLQSLGKTFELEVCNGAHHGFFSEDRATYDQEHARRTWSSTLSLLREKLGD